MNQMKMKMLGKTVDAVWEIQEALLKIKVKKNNYLSSNQV